MIASSSSQSKLAKAPSNQSALLNLPPSGAFVARGTPNALKNHQAIYLRERKNRFFALPHRTVIASLLGKFTRH